MLVDTLINIGIELDEIIDRIDTLKTNKELSKDNSQKLAVSCSYIGAAIQVLEDVLNEVKINDL